MPSQKKKLASFYRIFTKVVAVFFIVLLLHSFPFFSFFKKSAQVVHYREYIKGEKNIGSDQGKIEEGAQTLEEIKEIEKAILAEVEIKLQEKGKSLQENQELEQAKEELDKAEEKHKERKKIREEKEKEYEKKITSPAKDTATFSPEEQKINADYGIAWAEEKSAENHRQAKLKNVREKVIENIQAALKEAELAITDLNIEFTKEKTWKKRSWQWSIWLDPIRVFLIQPLQWISRQCGIISLGVVWDLLLKALIMRLLLNWISYPPKLADLDLAKPREKSEPTDLASLEEEREIAKRQLEAMKQSLFNMAMGFLLISAFSLHPFAFDRSNEFFSSRQATFLPWMLLYLVVFFFSQFISTLSYQKISLGNYLRKGTTWFSIAFGFGLAWFFYAQIGRFGDYLFALLSEAINIFINLVKMAYRRSKPPKKEKIKWERKKAWSYHNYKN